MFTAMKFFLAFAQIVGVVVVLTVVFRYVSVALWKVHLMLSQIANYLTLGIFKAKKENAKASPKPQPSQSTPTQQQQGKPVYPPSQYEQAMKEAERQEAELRAVKEANPTWLERLDRFIRAKLEAKLKEELEQVKRSFNDD
jgi:hypothetical protein